MFTRAISPSVFVWKIIVVTFIEGEVIDGSFLHLNFLSSPINYKFLRTYFRCLYPDTKCGKKNLTICKQINFNLNTSLVYKLVQASTTWNIVLRFVAVIIFNT